MVIAYWAESPSFTGIPSRPSKPGNEEAEDRVVNKPNESKASLLRNHWDLKKNGEDRLEHVCHDRVEVADAFVKSKEDFTEMLSNFETMCNGLLDRSYVAKRWIVANRRRHPNKQVPFEELTVLYYTNSRNPPEVRRR